MAFPDEFLADDLAAMLRNSQSRRFLWWIIGQCGIYHVNSEKELRNLGLKLIAQIEKTDPMAYADLFHKMTQEALQHRRLLDQGMKVPNADAE